jgi:rhamnogalacturonyl hydrolase YesR
MLARVTELQRPDGSFGQIVDDAQSWPEASSTAMFAFALISAARRDWLGVDTAEDAACRAWLATCAFLDDGARLRDVCVGAGHASHVVGPDPDAQRRYYLGLGRETGDLHGQAPLLWAAAELADASRPG